MREGWCSPFVVYGFDDEPECGAHRMNVFIHDLLDYGRFPCVIQSTLTSSVSASLLEGPNRHTASKFSSLYLSNELFVGWRALSPLFGSVVGR